MREVKLTVDPASASEVLGQPATVRRCGQWLVLSGPSYTLAPGP